MRWLAVAVAVAILGSDHRAIAEKPPRALVVVVAKGSKITSLTRAELRRCFSGDSLVIDDQRLIPFNYLPGTPERLAFDDVVLGMSAEQVGRFWVDRKIRGDGAAPRALPSALYVTKIVAKFPNAISYLPADQVTADLVAVAIDGVLPSSPRYPFTINTP